MAVEALKDLTTSTGNQALVEIWTKEIENSSEYEKKWRLEAEKFFKIYKDEFENEFSESRRYNVFWSNTQTLRPLVFSKLPKPNITPTFLDNDEISQIISEMIERAISLQFKTTNSEDIISKCRDDFLIGGRGIARVVYDPEEIIELENGEKEIDPSEKKCRFEYVDWSNFRMSTEKEWTKVRWIAFRHFMTREELVEDFGNIGNKVSLDYKRLESISKNTEELLKLAEVWEVWDKEKRTVYFLTVGGDGILLDKQEDPYNLQNFFPIAAPLGSKSDPCSLIPVPLYRMYKAQAEELNKVDNRIKSLIEQCKATGLYAKIAEGTDMENLFNGDDGQFTPMASNAMQKIQDLVMFKPLTEIITAIRELQQHKIEIINAIRDITGISDIVRGVSVASETATAQNLKGNFAISRIQPLQKEVEFWARDLIRLQVELLVENYSIDELAKMTNLEIIDINNIAKVAKERLKLLMMEAQRNIDPNDLDAQQKMELLKQQAEKGYKETLKEPLQKLKGYAATPEQLQEIEKIIKNDRLRNYSVDVETDSTIKIDQQQEKQDRIEYIRAISDFSNSFFPLVKTGIITQEAFNQFLIFISKPFKVGRTIEEALLPEKDPTQEEKQPSAEEMLAQAQIQLEQQKLQLEAQKVQNEANLKQQEIDIKKAEQLFAIEKHKDQMEFEDVNKQADREAKRLDMIVKARTEILNDQIRQANQPAQI